MQRILLTGSSGFVGSVLAASLESLPHCVISKIVRKRSNSSDTSHIEIGNIDAKADFSEALVCVTVVVHCAARAHIMNDTSTDPLQAYRQINVDGTRNLAEQAAAAGVKRFIYLSSIKVNGEATTETPFTAQNSAHYEDAYGQSKFEAEQALWEISQRTGLEVVIIRPPLVYGPGVKGNFASLVKLVKKGMPLPLGAVNNQRSLVALDNLVDLIITCIDHPAAANQTFLVSDDDDVSTTKLLRRMAQAFGKQQLLLPLPKWIMALPAKLVGKQGAVDRLFGSLQVDISHTKETLGWHPPVTMQQQLRKIADSLESK